uniref:Uncharacterized protein n=1 Tax=Anguilla anguilla TaxID=7936 RepID=A0A0E9UQ94_ANGAN
MNRLLHAQDDCGVFPFGRSKHRLPDRPSEVRLSTSSRQPRAA